MMEIDRIILGDCRDVMKTYPDNFFHSVVCDPPYELTSGKTTDKKNSGGFMGKAWDGSGIAYDINVWRECLRVLKPGGHLLAFGGTRTYHRMACAIEDAGFECRDMLEWVYGSGFPKSLDISKKIDQNAPRIVMFADFAKHFAECRKTTGISQKEISKNFPSKTGGLTGCVWNWENGANVPTLAQWTILQPILGLSDEFKPLIERIEAEREVIGKDGRTAKNSMFGIGIQPDWDITKPSTPAAIQWAGFGTALKPSHEPIGLFRKPLDEATIAGNVLKWGCGGLAIDKCRIGASGGSTQPSGMDRYNAKLAEQGYRPNEYQQGEPAAPLPAGRFPSNLIWSHSPNCQRIGTKKVKGHKGYPNGPGGLWSKEYQQKSQIAKNWNNASSVVDNEPWVGYADADGMETIESWDCAPDCPSWEFAKAGKRLPGRDGTKKTITSTSMFNNGGPVEVKKYCDAGSVSRFFKSCQPDVPPFVYMSKASKSDRGEGNTHCTTKPSSLIQYLCKLITPPGGIILDPFSGSGTLAIAAIRENFHYICIEKESEYIEICKSRIAAELKKVGPKQLDLSESFKSD